MAGQDAQLLLKVGLDLTAFRQSLAGLGAASAGYSLPINVKISRDALNKELANLTTALGKKKFKVELNIAGGLTESQLGKIQERLKTLAETKKVEIPVSVGTAGVTKAELRKVVASLNRSVRSSDALVNGKLRVPATIVSSITKADVNAFAADVKEKLKAQTKVVQQAKPAAMEIAVDEAKFSAFVNRLIKGPLVELHAAMRKAGIGMADAGEGEVAKLKAAILSGIPQLTSDISKGIAQGLDPKLKENGRSGAKNLIDGFKESTGIASPSKIFKQLGSFLVEGLEIGFTDRFKTFKGKALAQVRDFVSALRIELAKVENITGRAGAGAMSAAPRGGKAYLSPAGPLPLNSREPWTPKAGGGYSPYMGGAWPATPSRFRALPPVANALKYTQWAGPLRPALPPAGMTTGSIARQAKVQARIAQAYVRSAERNAGEYGQPGRLALPSGEMRVQSRVAALMKDYRIGGKNQGYSAPIGPLSEGSTQPWAAGSRGMHGQSGFEPRLRSSALGPKVEDPWVGQAGKAIGASITKAIAAIPAQKLLPMAGQTSYQGRLRSMFAGLPAIKSPSISKAGEESLSERGSYLLGKARRTLGLSGTYGQASVGASGLTGIAQQRLSPMAGGSTQFGGITSALQNSATQASSATGKFSTLKDALNSLGERAIQVARSVARESKRAVGISSFGDNRRMILQVRKEMAMEFDLMDVTRRRNAAGISYAPGSATAPSTPASSSAGGGGGPGSIPPSGGGGGRGGGFLGGMQFNRPQLPGAGAVEGLGVEFGMAAKQVLLFGTAYKALAFATDFPAQVGQAVSQLQSFRNTLKAITPSATEFGTSTKFIVSLVDQYNIPLQSAREGFAKLYASMKPAGFSGAEIRGLFEGISMGAATFGMSADKVDRVMYAFAQMASKGQVMSEELKGQLGDVLPGALALFARSAKMNVQEFGKAMEDGAFKGKAMRQLLINVGATMKEEFGPGAVGAALTFQGVMNRLQTSVVLFYEAFEPAAIIFANTFVLPLTNGIRVVTDGFKQLMTGQQAVTQGGAELAAQMQPLIPAFQGIAANLVKVGQAAATVIKGVMPVVQLMLQLAASPVVGWLAQMYASTLLLHGAFVLLGGNVLLGLIAGLARVAIVFAGVSLAATTTNTALVGTQLQLRMLSSGVAMTGAAMTGFAATVRAAMLTTAVGAVVVAVGIMISELMRLRGVQDEIEGRYKSLGDQARLMGESGNTQGIQRLRDAAVAQANTYEKIMQGIDRAEKGRAGKSFFNVDKETADLIKRAGQGSLLTGGTQISAGDIANLKAAINLNRERFKENEKINNDQMAKARRRQAEMDSASQKGLIPEGEGADEKARKEAARRAEKLAKLQDKLAGREQQLAIDAANRQTALDDSTFAHKLAMSDAHYDHLKALQEDSFNREMSGLDSIEARQKKFQQDLKAIESRRIESIRKAEIDAQKAVQDFRTASIKVAAASGGGGMGGGKAPKAGQVIDKSVFRDWMATQGFGRTTGDFTNAGHSTPNHMLNAMDMGILGGSNAEALRKTKAMEAKLAATGAFGGQLYGPTRDPYGHGAGKGGGNIHLHIPTPGGKIKVTPGLSQLMETGNVTTPRSQVGLKTRSGEYAMGRREDKTSGQLAVEMLGMQQGEEKKLLAIRYANKLAIEQTVTTIRQNIDTIFPVKEQQLENDLLELRNKLELKGVSREVIDMEVQKTKNAKESAAAQASATKEMISSKTALKQLQDKKTLTEDESIYMGYLVEKIAALNQEMASLPSKQEAFNVQLARTAELVAAQKTPQAILANTAAELQKQYAEMTNLGAVATNVASTISGAFGTAFQGVISGSMTAQQALSSFFKSVGEAFMDMAAKMIAKWMEMQIIGLVQSLLGAGLGALGGGAGGGFGLGGAGSGTGGAVGSLGGAMSPTTSLPSFSDSFGSFSGGGFGVAGFAEGGIPPIGVPSLVGEQGPELFVPRTAGTVIPADTTAAAMARYQRQGSSSAPSAMEGLPAAAGGIPILSMNFETTQFMGQDWVSKDQLVAAMAATEKRATAAGAKAGAQQVATKMRTSPAFRRQVGV